MIPNDIHETLIGALAIAAVKATLNVEDGDAQTRQLISIREARDWLDAQLAITDSQPAAQQPTNPTEGQAEQ